MLRNRTFVKSLSLVLCHWSVGCVVSLILRGRAGAREVFGGAAKACRGRRGLGAVKNEVRARVGSRIKDLCRVWAGKAQRPCPQISQITQIGEGVGGPGGALGPGWLGDAARCR